jgi:hypothetical protein
MSKAWWLDEEQVCNGHGHTYSKYVCDCLGRIDDRTWALSVEVPPIVCVFDTPVLELVLCTSNFCHPLKNPPFAFAVQHSDVFMRSLNCRPKQCCKLLDQAREGTKVVFGMFAVDPVFHPFRADEPSGSVEEP